MYNKELYIPRLARVVDVKELTMDTRLFRLVFDKREKGLLEEHEFLPGQFVQVSVFGAGEVPISIASSPDESGYLEISVRRVGLVTSALHNLKAGDKLGIRGPFGNHFPLDTDGIKRFIYVGGGCGIAPLRSLIKYMLKHPEGFSEVIVLYGARTLKDILFKEEFYGLREQGKLKLYLTVDCGPADEHCEVGLVTSLFEKFKDLSDARIFICGPEIMLHFTVKELLRLNASPERIILSLERYMKCGVGKCGHCYIGTRYVCTDGPVFSYKDLCDTGVMI